MDLADIQLPTFVSDLKDLHGLKNLWAWSAFSFEDGNRYILRIKAWYHQTGNGNGHHCELHQRIAFG